MRRLKRRTRAPPPQYQTGRKIRTQPLHFRNPYYSGRTSQHPFPSFNSTMNTAGITSIEKRENEQRALRAAQLDNAGIDLSKLSKNGVSYSIPLPGGVQSVEDRDKNQDAMRKIQRETAGIRSVKDRQLVKLAQLEELRRRNLRFEKNIEYLALHADEDGVPAEFQEEVAEYYREHPGAIALRDRWLKSHKKMLEDRRKAGKNAIDQYDFMHLDNYDPITGLPKNDDEAGHGSFGVRAARLHNLVRPIKYRHPLDKPEEMVDERKKEVEDLQDEYKKQQTELRGVPPPNDMAKRAFPDSAEAADIPLFQPTTRGVILHPFIFPIKKPFASGMLSPFVKK